jgi:tetratricopeptide (TPR) repeat protein
LLLLVASAGAVGETAPPRFDEALAKQQRWVMEHPTDIAALNDLGNLLVQVGKLEAAEAAYRRSLELDPGHVSSRYNLALVLLELGHKKEARTELKQVLHDQPTHAWAHYQLGAIYEEQGHRSRAVRQYAAAFALDGSLADSLYNPHVVGNKLVTEALLESYDRQIPAVQVPRSYSEPERVTQLLLPIPEEVEGATEQAPQPPLEVDEVEPTEAAPRARHRPQKFHGSFSEGSGAAASDAEEAPGGAEAESADTEDDLAGLEGDGPMLDEAAELDDTTEEPQADDAENEVESDVARERRERRERRNASSGLPGLVGAFVGGPADTQAPEQGTGSTTRPPTSSSPSGPRSFSGSSSPPRGFTPGVTSTGRLDLELLPLADPQPAVIAG